MAAVVKPCVRALTNLGIKSSSLDVVSRHCRIRTCSRRGITSQVWKDEPQFGFMFDIDGVLVRGREVLPSAHSALDKLIDHGTGKFRVPTVFVTNAGNTLRQAKAKQLSEWLGVKISEDQVIMSHSPLKMFNQFQDKTVLVSGQGPVTDIAKMLGFNKAITIEALRRSFPMLDMVDHRRRRDEKSEYESYFPRIEAVILFGEPVRWETNLQLIIDVLLTNGHPDYAPSGIPDPHLPILACNMDLLWMAEACMPRMGHGCFLHCLETLYHKITGRHIKYTALIGKPSEVTYHHAEYILNQHAKSLGVKEPVRRVYCVGDNPETDIYGANLYNRYLRNKRPQAIAQKLVDTVGKMQTNADGTVTLVSNDNLDSTVSTDCELLECAESCDSILVHTGVYDQEREYSRKGDQHVFNHNHRDFLVDSDLKVPSFSVANVLDAVELVFEREEFS